MVQCDGLCSLFEPSVFLLNLVDKHQSKRQVYGYNMASDAIILHEWLFSHKHEQRDRESLIYLHHNE